MVKCNVSLCCVKTLLNRAVDLSADRFKLPIYFTVGKPQYLNSILLNDTASFVIVKLSLFCIVLRTVQLNDQFCFCAIKVNDKKFYHTLVIDFYRIITQKTKSGCPLSNLSVCFADSSPGRGASGEEARLCGMPRPPLARGGGIA